MAERNGFFGLDECKLFPMTDEANFGYAETCIDVGKYGGIVEISLEPSTSNDSTYASDTTWLNEETDQGFSGTLKIINGVETPELRRDLAPLVGWEVDENGRVLGSSGKPRKPFALMAEHTGNARDKRVCYLKCQLGKPSKNGKTKEDGSENQPDEFPITAYVVKLPNGWKGSFYEDYEDTPTYATFFDAVDIQLAGATFVAVTPEGTENPKTEGWYEKVSNSFVPSEDTTVDNSKTYYAKH